MGNSSFSSRQSLRNNRATILLPNAQAELYRNIYLYLQETIAINCDLLSQTGLAQELYNNYSNGVQPLMAAVSTKVEKNTPIIPKINMNKKPDLSTIAGDDVQNCKKCSLSEGRRRFIKYGGPTKKGIMVVGDIPDYYDEVQGFCFTDKIRELLAKILKACNLELNDIYLTTLIKCTSAIEIGSDLTEVEKCLVHFEKEMTKTKPKIIIAFGELSYKLLFKKKDFTDMRGKILDYKNTKVIFTHHPRELIYDLALKKETWDDLKNHLSLFK